MDRLLVLCRERRPSWYVSFEMACLMTVIAFGAGIFTGTALVASCG